MIELIRKDAVMDIIKDQLAEITKGQRHCVDQCKLNVQAVGYRIDQLPAILIPEEKKL